MPLLLGRGFLSFCFGKVVGQVDSALTQFLIFGESAVEDNKEHEDSG